MKTLTIKQKDKFIDDLMKYYLQNNFGSFTKTELEELFIELLDRYSNFGEMTNFERSICLHIPESKVRGTMYRSQLKYQEYKDEVTRKKLFRLLWLGAYKVKKDEDQKTDIITIIIEDQYLKKAIEGKLKDLNEGFDGTFNKEALVVQKESLMLLIEDFFNEEEQELALEELHNKNKKLNYKRLSDFFSSCIEKVSLEELGKVLWESMADGARAVTKAVSLLLTNIQG